MAAGKTSFRQNVELICTYKNGVSIDDGQRATTNALNTAGVATYCYTMELAKAGYVSVTNILAAFMTVFSLIAMVVCLVMIIFTINNNIDRDVKNIGALRAVGHTTSQVRTALLVEYLLIGFIGYNDTMLLQVLTIVAFLLCIIRLLSRRITNCFGPSMQTC